MRVVNYRFEHQEVVLDFHEFKGCTFTGCNLVYFGHGPVTLDTCTFDSCQWNFSGPAANALQFMTGLYHAGVGAKELIEQTIDNIRRGGHPHKP